MAKLRLEIEELQILRPKKRWKLYLIVVTEDPDDPDKTVVTTMPNPFWRLKPRAGNIIDFDGEGDDVGAEGFFVLEREMPADRTLKVDIYLRHSRKNMREIGDTLQDIKGELGADAFGTVSDILGTTSPWLAIAKTAVPLLGGILKKIKDRDFGSVSMSEEFGSEFDEQLEVDRRKTFSSGDAKIVYSWVVRD